MRPIGVHTITVCTVHVRIQVMLFDKSLAPFYKLETYNVTIQCFKTAKYRQVIILPHNVTPDIENAFFRLLFFFVFFFANSSFRKSAGGLKLGIRILHIFFQKKKKLLSVINLYFAFTGFNFTCKLEWTST